MLSITRTILGQHIQIPQRHASRQALGRTRADRGTQLQEAEKGHVLRAGTHAHELDLREDEAVAAAVFAHAALQVGQSGQVEDFLLPDLVPHARVPAVVGFHQTDDAAAPVAGEGLLDVVLVVGDEVRAVGLVGLLRAHRDVVVAAETDFQGVVDLVGVVVAAEVSESGFGGRLEAGARDGGFGEGGCGNVDAEEAGEVGDVADGGEVEVGPGAEVADVPPEMGLFAVSLVVVDFRYEVDGRIGTGEVFGDAQGFGIVVHVA